MTTRRTNADGSVTETGRCTECGTDTERTVGANMVKHGLLDKLPLTCQGCEERDRKVREAEADRQHAEHMREERVRRALIPPVFASAGPDGCPPRALASAERWGRGEIAGLYLGGRVGVGKSYLAAYATRLRAEHGRPVRWYGAPELFATLRGDFGDDAREMAQRRITGQDRAWRASGPPLDLVIDDLDKTRPTEFAAEQLYIALNHCLEHGRGLAITTNLTLEEIAAGSWIESRWGEPIASRIRGLCPGAMHRLGGTDRRGAA